MVIFAMMPPPTAPGRLRFRKVGKKAVARMYAQSVDPGLLACSNAARPKEHCRSFDERLHGCFISALHTAASSGYVHSG